MSFFVIVGDRLSVKWPSRLSLGVKSPNKAGSLSYLPQVLFQSLIYLLLRHIAEQCIYTHTIDKCCHCISNFDFDVILCLFMQQFPCHL